jgi:hypothetical protein
MSLPLMGVGPSAPGTGFDPSTISGLQLWLKADAIVGLADTDPVTTWEDSSSANNDATQGTAALKPTYRTNQINGKAAVSFDDGDHLASALSMATKPFSVFAVANFTNFSVPRTILGQSSAGGLQFRGNTTPRQEILKAETASIGVSTSALSTGTNYRLAATYSNTGVFTFYLNGTADGTGTNDQTFTASTAKVGDNRDGAESMLGLIAEILFYDSVLSAGDRGSVNSYLATKYGL